MAKVRVYHAVNVDDKQVVIDIHEIANESIRKMKLEYPDYDIVIMDDHPIGEGHLINKRGTMKNIEYH